MVQLDHFDSGNTITPENDDACEVSTVLPACPTCCLQLRPASPHTKAPSSSSSAILGWEMLIQVVPKGDLYSGVISHSPSSGFLSGQSSEWGS